MLQPIYTENYKNHTIKIIPDFDPLNPRKEYDHAGTMVCWHSRYNLGDKNPFDTPQDALDHFKEHNSVFLPLYLYDHSGVTISTKPFSCPWDSGQAGFIYADQETIAKEWGNKPEARDKAIKYLKAEVETYDQYINGQVYGFVIEDSKGEEIEDGSCWGFYGDYDGYVLTEAKSIVDYTIQYAMKEHQKQVKQWIRNKVPLQYRKACRVF